MHNSEHLNRYYSKGICKKRSNLDGPRMVSRVYKNWQFSNKWWYPTFHRHMKNVSTPLFKLLMNYTEKTIMNLTEFSPGLALFFWHLVFYFRILLFKRQFTLEKKMEHTFFVTFHEMSTKWRFVLFNLQERLDLAALGTTSWVAEEPSFSTREKHEVAENIPGDDQCHRLDGWN